jgi:hypothetical protein
MWRTLASRQPVGAVRRKVSLTSLCSSMVMATCGMLRDRVAQRQGAMRGQLDDEALGQRLDAVLLVVLRLAGWPPMVMTARWTAGVAGWPGRRRLRRIVPSVSTGARPRDGHSRDRPTASRRRRG